MHIRGEILVGVGQELVSKGESHEKKEMSILLWFGDFICDCSKGGTEQSFTLLLFGKRVKQYN